MKHCLLITCKECDVPQVEAALQLWRIRGTLTPTATHYHANQHRGEEAKPQTQKLIKAWRKPQFYHSGVVPAVPAVHAQLQYVHPQGRAEDLQDK